MTIDEAILCETGAQCTQPILFQGITNNRGKIKVNEDIFNYHFNIIVEGYRVNGPFQKENSTDIFIGTYADGTTYEFDYRKDNMIILVESKI